MIKNILEIGVLGSLVFTAFLVFMSISGIAGAVRDDEGQFRKKVSFKSILGILIFLCFLIGLLYIANVRYAHSLQAIPGLTGLWINSMGVFLIVHIYDLLVLDYLIIVKWHPKFLNLPDTKYYTTIRPHVIGFFKGIPFGIILSLIASLLFLWIK